MDYLKLDFEDFDKLLSNDEFKEEPVPLDVFVRDKKYLNLYHPLSDIQSEFVERATQIYKLPTLINLYGEEKANEMWGKTTSEIVCEWGKGSGKDHSSRISMAYTVYKLHCLSDPMVYFNKAQGGYIDLLNLAVNANQAQNVFFDPLKNMLARSPWFQNEGMYEPRVSELKFYNAPIRCFSGHSESEAWEGYDFLMIVLDEISAFKTDAEIKTDGRSRNSASQIYDMSKASVSSRFGEIGKIILLSFPRFENDFIEQKYYEVSRHVHPCSEECHDEVREVDFGGFQVHGTWAIKKATWEVNPTKTKEDFAPEFARDPVRANQRYACLPPKMEDAFFRNPDIVREAFRKCEDPMNEDGSFKPWFNGRDGKPRYIFVDLASKRDRSAVCMVHCDGYSIIETLDGFQQLPTVKMDILKYWEAGPGQEIDFAAIRHFIFELKKTFSISGVWMDYWNSKEFKEALIFNGVPCDNAFTKKPEYDTLSTLIYDGRLHGYWNDILVEDELLKLKLLANAKVDHPATGYKDGADTLAGAVSKCIEASIGDTDLEVDIFISTSEVDKFDPEPLKEKDMLRSELPQEPQPPETIPEELESFLLGLEMI